CRRAGCDARRQAWRLNQHRPRQRRRIRPAMPKTAGIILIGNEILSGKTVDANAAYLCRELRELGVEVRRVVVIPDEVSLIAEEVAAFSKAFDLVFTSGGVGPTH